MEFSSAEADAKESAKKDVVAQLIVRHISHTSNVCVRVL